MPSELKRGNFPWLGGQEERSAVDAYSFLQLTEKGQCQQGTKTNSSWSSELLVDLNQPGAELAETQQCTTESRLILILAN